MGFCSIKRPSLLLLILLLRCCSATQQTASQNATSNIDSILTRRQLMYRYHGIPVDVPSDLESRPGPFSTSPQISNLRSLKKRRERNIPQRGALMQQQLLALPGKKGAGLVMNDVTTNIPQLISLRPYWSYHWGPLRPAQQPDNIEFVPMIFKSYGPLYVQSTMNNVIRPMFEAGLAKRLLGFNEPDNVLQANMTVSSAISYWPELEVPYMPLASPAVATLEGAWMAEFVSQVESLGYRMDYIAVHWYGPANIQTFKNEMISIYQTYGSKWPLLITEFAPADWTAQTVAENRFQQSGVLNFMKSVLPWLEEQDWIYGYAWFPFSPTFPAGASSALFDINGNLTAVGKFYSSVTTGNKWGNQNIHAV